VDNQLFYTTARGALYHEASLPPISSICKHGRLSAALRPVCAPSKLNPATAPIPDSVPTRDQGRSVDDHCFLLQASSKAIHLTSRLCLAVNCAKHLPLDSMCHETTDLIVEVPLLPLTSTDLVSLPLQRESAVTYQALRSPLEQLLLSDWLFTSPPVPLSYPYGACLSPHAFTGLPRFICGCFHQMRTGASHLSAHISWRNRDSSTVCPFCEEDDEFFQHAILLCPAKVQPRLTHVSGVDDIGPNATLLLSVALPRRFTEYLYATHTGFPPAMLRIRASTGTPETGSLRERLTL